MQPIFTLISLLFSTSLWSAPLEGRAIVFGSALMWNTRTMTNNNKVARHVKQYHEDMGKALDPDCYYCPRLLKARLKKTAKKRSNTWTKKAESMANEFGKETGGEFNIYRAQYDKNLRDFGGLGQGFLLERLKKDMRAPYWANFAGDIYYSGKLGGKRIFYVGEPELETMPQFKVKMNKGWLITSNFKPNETRSGKSGKLLKRAEYRQITLVANPAFNGARLDAWATAIVSGGQKTLNRLWSNKKFKGQWAYMGLDSSGQAFCSENLNCKLRAPRGQNSVAINW